MKMKVETKDIVLEASTLKEMFDAAMRFPTRDGLTELSKILPNVTLRDAARISRGDLEIVGDMQSGFKLVEVDHGY